MSVFTGTPEPNSDLEERNDCPKKQKDAEETHPKLYRTGPFIRAVGKTSLVTDYRIGIKENPATSARLSLPAGL